MPVETWGIIQRLLSPPPLSQVGLPVSSKVSHWDATGNPFAPLSGGDLIIHEVWNGFMPTICMACSQPLGNAGLGRGYQSRGATQRCGQAALPDCSRHRARRPELWMPSAYTLRLQSPLLYALLGAPQEPGGRVSALCSHLQEARGHEQRSVLTLLASCIACGMLPLLPSLSTDLSSALWLAGWMMQIFYLPPSPPLFLARAPLSLNSFLPLLPSHSPHFPADR